MKDLIIKEDNLKKASTKFRAINHKLRVSILQLIHKKGKMKVQDIHHKLKIEQSVTSHQLSILRNAGLVLTNREGRCIYYSLNYEGLRNQHLGAMKLLGTDK